MELLDRYLQAVRFWLPKAQQEDILAELRANIQAQMEDQEAGLGRPLSQDEQAAILKQHGSPMLVASQYGGQRRQLIGPALFPVYRLVMKASLVSAFAIYFLVAGILTITTGRSIVDQILHTPSLVLTVFTWVTLVFAGLEMSVTRFHLADRWDPKSLPALIKLPRSKHHRPISRLNSLFEVVFGTLFGVWWLAALRSPHLIFGPGASVIAFGPAWHKLFLLIALGVLMGPATACVNLVRPDWIRLRAISRAVASALGVLLALLLLKDGSLIVAAGASDPDNVVEIMNRIFSVGMMVGIGFWAVQGFWGLWRLARRPRLQAGLRASG
jgi:hypothetical protein